MEQLDRLGWAAAQSWECHGVRFALRVQRGALPPLGALLPPHTTARAARRVDRLYSLIRPDGAGARRGVRRHHLLYGDTQLLGRALDPAELLTLLGDDLKLRVAELAPRRVFVHAGVVGWRGRAILLPGASQAGKSTLVAELVRRGATYYSDEFAVLDGRGRVWPFARPISLRGEPGEAPRAIAPESLGAVGEGPLPVGLVWLTRHARAEAPQTLSPGRAALAILAHATAARRRPQAVLAAIGALVRRVPVLDGARGEAGSAAARLLDGAFA
jgi:hypothetical protein